MSLFSDVKVLAGSGRVPPRQFLKAHFWHLGTSDAPRWPRAQRLPLAVERPHIPRRRSLRYPHVCGRCWNISVRIR